MTTHKEALKIAIKIGNDVCDMEILKGTPTDDADDIIFTSAFRAYLDARNLVMIPKEPTDKMIEAGRNTPLAEQDVYGIYRAMIDAALEDSK